MLLILYLLFGIIITCLVLIWILSKPFYWKRKGLKYLFPLPVFGNSLPLTRMSIANFYKYLYNVYPNEKYFGFHYFTRPTLLVRDQVLLKDILIKDYEYFTSNGMYSNEDSDPFGPNLLFLHGQRWKEIRNKLSVQFTPSKVRIVNEYIKNTIEKAIKRIDENVKINQPTEITKITVGIAVDVVVQAVFGIETDCFEENSQFLIFAKKFLSDSVNLRLILSMLIPKLNRVLKMHILDRDVTTFLQNVLKDVMKYRENNNVNKEDFVDAMMKMMKTEAESNGKKEKYFPDNTLVPEYNFKTILAQALILMSGGMESSAMTMAFFLYEASLNQEIQDKCREEVMAIVDETGSDVRPEEISKLKYLNMALKETLRKYPPFAILTRECTKTYKLNDKGVTIEPGTFLLIPLISIQRDPNNYPNPEEFIPERFSPENKTTLFTWGLGPRSCIGKPFAKMEMFLALSRLLRRYRFTLSSKTKVPIEIKPYKTVTTPDPGIFLDIEPINL